MHLKTYMQQTLYKNSFELKNICRIKVKILKFSRGFNFRETSHMRSFVKIKSSRNCEITLLIGNITKSHPCHGFYNVANMPFNAIPETGNHAKITEFTVIAA